MVSLSVILSAGVATFLLSIIEGAADICPNATGGALEWDSNSKRCIPAAVCGNTILTQIPDVAGHIPMSILCNVDASWGSPFLSKLYDKEASRDCLKKKRLCILGDSTIEESIHDIVVLLSGIGDDPRRVKMYYDSMVTALNPVKFNINDVQLDLTGTGISGDRAHRLMEVTIPELDFSLYHHFTGHRILNANGEGITALLFRLEDLFASKLHNCDLLLINSAAHDFAHQQSNADCQIYPLAPNSTCLEDYMPNIIAMHRLIDKLYGSKNKVRVFWKGDAHSANIGGFMDNKIKVELEEKVAYAFRHSSASLGFKPLIPITFINITGPLAALPYRMMHASFHHIGQHSHREMSPMPLLWSSVSTQVIMDHICSADVRIL